MKSLLHKLLIAMVVAFVLSLLTFVVLDGALGEPMSLECYVTGKYYVPPETHVTVDEDGMVTVDTDPEEFHVLVTEVVEMGQGYNLSTSQYFFTTLTNNQIIRVSARLGRWTQAIHIGAIEGP